MPDLATSPDLPMLTTQLGGWWLVVRIKNSGGCIPGVMAFSVKRLRSYGTNETNRELRNWVGLKDPEECYDIDHTVDQLHDLLAHAGLAD